MILTAGFFLKNKLVKTPETYTIVKVLTFYGRWGNIHDVYNVTQFQAKMRVFL